MSSLVRHGGKDFYATLLASTSQSDMPPSFHSLPRPQATPKTAIAWSISALSELASLDPPQQAQLHHPYVMSNFRNSHQSAGMRA